MRQLLVPLVAGLLAIDANAADVYEQLPNHQGSFLSDGISYTVADDFQFAQNTVVSTLTWWGGDIPGDPAPDNFTINFYTDSGGQPGALVGGIAFGSVSAFATGQFMIAPDLYPESEYSVNLTAPFSAQAGTRYWVSIFNPGWFWEVSANLPNPGVQRRFNSDPWAPFNSNAAFRVNAVPEPQGALLLGGGLAGVVMFASRRRCARCN